MNHIPKGLVITESDRLWDLEIDKRQRKQEKENKIFMSFYWFASATVLLIGLVKL